jgi:hypothetical protein
MIRQLTNLAQDLDKEGFSKEAGAVDDILDMISKALERANADPEEAEEVEAEQVEAEQVEAEQVEAEQVEFHGKTTENFDLCPGAVNAFSNLDEKIDEDSEDIALEALVQTDKLLGIEKEVLDAGSASIEEFKKVVELAQSISYKAGTISKILDIDLSNDFAFLNMHIEKVSGLTKFCQIQE